MSRRKTAQRLLNEFFASRKLGYKPLKVDGKLGVSTKYRIRLARVFLGVGSAHTDDQDDTITDALLDALRHPRKRIRGYSPREHAARLLTAGRRQRARRRKVAQAARARAARTSTKAGPPAWGGSRAVADEIAPVAKRYGAPLTSTKRAANHPLTIANPGSDHSWLARLAYARDQGTRSGAKPAVAIRRHYGNMGGAVGTYAVYYVRRRGRLYRLQTLWAVPGHYDHVHHGVRAS